ncbi:unnamed protein product [Heligmosomoides polygyrus]|uniref:PAZ domain-containing protein n=1 Tax=Heligmosomoides polygyrus TaxID=6339 RepID=A0A3P7ZPE9_HELPZ|nr:unnamed protein product [Heligmosomoides polygyrus]
MFSEDHIVFGNKAYERSSKHDTPLPQGKIVKCGFEKNCRVVESAGEALAMLQIGAKKSPFFSQVSVVAFCEAYLGLDNRRGMTLEDALRNKRSINEIVKQLKDVAVRTTHTDTPRVLYINGLSKDSAHQARFEHEGEEISVNEYFMKRYKRQLKHPNLPLCIERKPQGVIYHPMEVLEIERGQRVTTEKQTPQISESMIKECQLPPIQMKKHIDEQMVAAMLCNDNPFLKEWGIKISSRPMRAVARRFHPPAISYGGGFKVQSNHYGDLQWRLGAKERSFVDALAKYCSQHGTIIGSRDVEVLEMSSEVEHNIESAMKHITGSSKYIMFTTKMKLDPVHGFMKRLEAQFGIVTQHVSSQTLNKAIGQKGAFMVLGNLCLKLNLKLGGVNHNLRACDQLISTNPGMRNVDGTLFPKTRMFVAFDVSHAGPQSFADRQMKKAQSEPTVVGMAYTIGEPTRIRGTYWMQEPRLALISDIGSNFAVALKAFYKETDSLPLDIVVNDEMQELQKAFVEVNHLYRHGMYSPSLTCVVVQTNSNYRIIPTKIDPHARPMDQNVPCGTVVDDAVHPAYNEFLIVPQKALQGTARTVRCTLVTHSKGTSGALPGMEELKQITNMLCHGHQKQVPELTLTKLDVADDLLARKQMSSERSAERKRALAKYTGPAMFHMGLSMGAIQVSFRDMDDASVSSGASGERGRLTHDGTPDFFKNLSARLHSDINAHYWA